MALSGLDIFKLLPKTNCGECGVPTCMAFAMKLAQKKAELGECPHVSEEARATLGTASEPPIRLVRIGREDPLEVGGETVMFRHEKTFYHQPGIAIEILSSESEDDLATRVREIERYAVDRVGEELRPDAFLIVHDSGQGGDLIRAIDLVRGDSSRKLIVDCPEREALAAGLERLKDDAPAVLLRNELSDGDIELARAFGAPLILSGASLEELATQASRARDAGLSDLLLSVNSENLGLKLQANTMMRRAALKGDFKPLGYPVFARIGDETGLETLANASALLCKYASIIALKSYDPALLYALLTLRQNIYTDPQKPIQVDARIYPVGEPTADSPVFVTTNFSLTYFIVSGEIENSGISAHLVVADCEGQSVLTAWAAGKFVGETVAKFCKSVDLEDQVKTRKIVIPGYAAQIQGDLEEGLPGWEVVVGPQEASDIPAFVKSVELA
jgi:acetyl-CoA decarbonylase/synthase complex subunit gamma